MFSKIGDFLYKVVHTAGRLFYISADIGAVHTSVWVGRESPDKVRFTLDIDLDYGPDYGPSLNVVVELGIIRIEFYLAKWTVN